MDEGILHGIDDTIHAKARLGIMCILVAQKSATFTALKDALGLTDGNLGSHVQALEDAGYITVRKDFVKRRPRTTCEATPAGRSALLAYVDALERMFQAVRAGEDDGPRTGARDPTPP